MSSPFCRFSARFAHLSPRPGGTGGFCRKNRHFDLTIPAGYDTIKSRKRRTTHRIFFIFIRYSAVFPPIFPQSRFPRGPSPRRPRELRPSRGMNDIPSILPQRKFFRPLLRLYSFRRRRGARGPNHPPRIPWNISGRTEIFHFSSFLLVFFSQAIVMNRNGGRGKCQSAYGPFLSHF